MSDQVQDYIDKLRVEVGQMRAVVDLARDFRKNGVRRHLGLRTTDASIEMEVAIAEGWIHDFAAVLDDLDAKDTG